MIAIAIREQPYLILLKEIILKLIFFLKFFKFHHIWAQNVGNLDLFTRAGLFKLELFPLEVHIHQRGLQTQNVFQLYYLLHRVGRYGGRIEDSQLPHIQPIVDFPYLPKIYPDVEYGASIGGKIMGGELAVSGQFPYQVYILHLGQDKKHLILFLNRHI